MSARDLLLSVISNSPPLGDLSIVGIVREDEELMATVNFVDPDGAGTLHYRWSIGDDANNPTGYIGTDHWLYTVTYADRGKYIFLEVYYTDKAGNAEIVKSINVVGPVLALDHMPTGTLNISGAYTVGSVITAKVNNLADVDGLGTVHYQWYSGNTPVGTDTTTYTAVKADIGKKISYAISYVDGRGNSFVSPKVSLPQPIVDQPTTGGITIAGTKIDDVVVPVSTITDADGIASIAYTWQLYTVNPPTAGSNVFPVPLADGSFKLAANSINNYLQCFATVTDGNGIITVFASNIIGPIANVNHPMTGNFGIQGGYPANNNIIEILPWAPTGTLADLDGMGPITYEWYIGTTMLFSTTDSTKTYTVTSSDYNKDIYVIAKQTDNKGNLESSKSNVIKVT